MHLEHLELVHLELHRSLWEELVATTWDPKVCAHTKIVHDPVLVFGISDMACEAAIAQ